MKKHDEGYALVLVLVVMIVMSLVVASVLALSLRNMQNQTASIQRMQDKYAAQGQIEKTIQDIVNAAAPVAISNASDISVSDDKLTLTLTLKAQSGTATVVCTVELSSKAAVEYDETANTYELTNPTYRYLSYEITYGEVAE